MDFARGLAELGVELDLDRRDRRGARATRGSRSGAIDDFTGFPEIMDGRVKTLHPKLYAGCSRCGRPRARRGGAEHGVEFVDLVCVNLYPFERTAARRGVDDAEVIENIDIGGPTMIRAAAKNHAFTAVVVKPEAYDAVLEELRAGDGLLSMATREALAADAFAYTARYDTAIARWFAERCEDFPPLFVRAFEKVVDLPYGENPHQRAAYYQQVGARMHLLSMVTPAPRQAALVQQPARPRRRARVVARLRGPGLRDRQAQQPVRRGGRADARSRPTSAPSPATRSARSAASSRSTAGSTRERPRRSPGSSSRCSSRPATTPRRSRS